MAEITFSITRSSSSTARLGSLRLQGRTHATPLLMVGTRRGTVPHLTPDLLHRTLSKSDYLGLQVHLEAMLEDASIVPKTTQKGIAELIGYGAPVFLACNEPEYYRATSPNLKNGPDWISVATTAGVVPLHLRETLPLVWQGLRPAVLFVPTDHYSQSTARLKRIRKSTDVSKHLWEVALRTLEDQTALRTSEDQMTLRTSRDQMTLCPTLCLHAESAEESERRVLVRGEMERRLQALASNRSGMVSLVCDEASAADIARLPRENAVFLRGSITPEQVVTYFRAGVDIFDSTFATDQATSNIALIIADDGKWEQLVLNDEKFFDDFSPLETSCGCIACDGPDKTTRSYLHHLVRTSEMLASVYLASHNLWQYARLCRRLQLPS